jgi:hypothetical protein
MTTSYSHSSFDFSSNFSENINNTNHTVAQVYKASALISRIAVEYSSISAIDEEVENLKQKHEIGKDVSSYYKFQGLEFSLEKFCTYIFGDSILDIKKLKTTQAFFDLFVKRSKVMSKIIKLESELLGVKYFSDLAYEAMEPVLRKEIQDDEGYIQRSKYNDMI